MRKNFSCDSTQKWACAGCTYLNWPKALRCVQCETPKEESIGYQHGSSENETTTTTIECAAGEDPEEDITDTFSSMSITEGNRPNSVCSEECGNKKPSSSPLISSLYITEPSSSRDGAITCNTNTMLEEEEENDVMDNGSSFSAMNNSMNTTNLLRNDTSTPLITDFDKSVKTKQKDNLISNEISHPFSNATPNSRRYSKFQETYNNMDEGHRRSKFSPEREDIGTWSEVRPKSTTTSSSTGSRGTTNLHSSPKSSPNNANTTLGNSNTDKWACGICTYDNWPRSVKCVMCLTPRTHTADTVHIRSRSANEERVVGLLNQSNEASVPLNSQRDSELSNNQTLNNRISSVGIGSPTILSSNRRSLDIDGRWLEACRGVVEGNIIPVEQFLAAGGDPARQLTQFEVAILNRPSAFDIGFTLIHLALRFHQEHVLAVLLSQVDNQPTVVKRVPSSAAPDLAMDIRRLAMASLRQRKGNFHCYFFGDIVTFILPSEILDLSPDVQETLFDEILDRDVQKELESGQIINWSVELMGGLGSRLYALWNRSAGDCLLDSLLQATWGIFDRDNGLRRALADSLHECATMFYQRWKENELLHAHLLDFSLNDSQCAADWAKLLSIASKPGSSLEQLHIFALAHILRRPVIVYGVKYVKSFRGETLGFARYEGVYLPFFWEPSFCWKSPVALGYTRGHFSALVGLEPDCVEVSGASASKLENDHINRSIFLPLNSIDGTILPIHFLSKSEIGKEEMILSQWLDVRFIESGVMVACQRIQKQPLLVSQMVEEWLNHYRRLGQITSDPFMHPPTATCYSSEDSDD